MVRRKMMKANHFLRIVLVGLALIILGACGQKSPDSIAKNVLKDSYTGFSTEHGYESSDFKGGVGTTLKFDKEKRTISNNDGESINYSVLSEEQVKAIPADFRGTLVSLESQLKGKDNFTIAVDYRNIDKPEEAEAYYQVVLTEGGKKIRIIELRRGYKEDNAFYDFNGTAD